MSKLIRYPNGFVSCVSDEVAMILCLRDGHRIVHKMPPVNTGAPVITFKDDEDKEEAARA